MDLNKDLGSNLLSLAPAIIPIISQAVQVVETPGNGTAKADGALAIARTSLVNLLPGNATAEEVEKLIDYARELIPVTVNVFNAIGKFFKSSSAPSTPVSVPAPAPAPSPIPTPVPVVPVQTKEQLTAHLANMKRRLAEFQAQPDSADKQKHVDELTKNIGQAEADLAKLG